MRWLLLIGLVLSGAAQAGETCFTKEGYVTGLPVLDPKDPCYSGPSNKKVQELAIEERKFKARCRESPWWRFFNSDCPVRGK